MEVLVTGASGFVGRTVGPALAAAGWTVRARTRANGPSLDDARADWRPHVEGAQAVVHLAAMVHQMGNVSHLGEAFLEVNARGAARLANAAVDAGVTRFVYMSSIKVHGEAGHFTADSPRHADDPYGQSKIAGEDAVMEVGARRGLEVVIVRPPLVYGPGVGANFRALANAVHRGWPLPLGLVRNRRSLIGVDNLADAVRAALVSPAAAGQAFLVSDGVDVSTADLIRALARAYGRSARLLPVPPSLLVAAAALLGRRQAIERLTGTLTLDITKARERLAWTPPWSLDEQLQRMAQA